MNDQNGARPANAKTDDLRPEMEDADGAHLTTNQGVRIEDDHNSLTAGERGPTLMEDFIFREKMTHFDHERIPERVVHARGSGAHGYFEVYEPLAELTKATFLQDPSVRTPVFVRFSTVVGFRGSADTVRDVRGFATKFYTEDGNFDLVGNNMPVFFIQDAIKFPDLVHAVKPEPHNDLFSYLDTQLIRLGGPNFAEIPINRPLAPVHNNQRDGYMRQAVNTGRVNYEPNSLRGGCPMQAPENLGGFVSYAEKVDGRKVRERSESFRDYFSQATLFWNSQSDVEKEHIVQAFHFELGKVESKDVRQRMVEMLANVDHDLAARVAKGIGVTQFSGDLSYLKRSTTPPPTDRRGAAEPGRSAALSKGRMAGKCRSTGCSSRPARSCSTRCSSPVVRRA